jgi:DNA-binding NarL/FixJ family response regulator
MPMRDTFAVLKAAEAETAAFGGASVKLFAVDEHEIFCRGIVACLAGLPDVESVGSAGTTAAALAQPELHTADVAIVDPRMDGGLALMRRLSGAGGPRLIACVERGGENVLLAAIDAGATGFVDRLTLTPDRLEASVRAAARGAGVMAPELLETLYRGVADREGAYPVAPALSERERLVLRLVADGRQTREVAAELCYSERTIKNVLHDVVIKLNVRTRSQAVAHAVRQGMI